MRAPVNKRRSKNRFNGRADRTHPLNTMNPRRGGIRL